MSGIHVFGQSTKYRNLLVVVKQTAYEEYSQLKLRGLAPKALRWKRLQSRYKAHKSCVDKLRECLQRHDLRFSCINRVDLDRQHLAHVDLVIAVGGDGTVLSAAHFLDHGTIPLLGINSDPIQSIEDNSVQKQTDERRSHGALCMCTAHNMDEIIPLAIEGGCKIVSRTRINCIVKSTFSETRLVPGLNDVLIANPSPAAVSRFRMGWLHPVTQQEEQNIHDNNNNLNKSDNGNPQKFKRTLARFGGQAHTVQKSLNAWSSGMWISTGTGATAAMAAAGGQPMPLESTDLQYLIREHIIEARDENSTHDVDNGFVRTGQKLHLRWNSHKGCVFTDGSHLTHPLELGDEIMIDNQAPPLQLFVRNGV